MKTRLLLLSMGLILTSGIFAQTTVKKAVVEIPKEFKKAKLAQVELTRDSQLNVVLSKKEVELYQFTFDQNLNTINSQPTTASPSENNSNPTPVSVGQKDGIVRFVRVVPSSFWGQMELEKGYIQKNYIDGRYIGEEFVAEKTIKGILTPDERKIIPISEMHVGIEGQSQNTRTLGLDKNMGFLSAGNLIALGGVFPKLVTKGRLGVGSVDTYIDYCVVKADANKLAVEKVTLIPFTYVQQTEICTEVANNRLMLISKDVPTPSKGSEEFYNKGSNTRTITIINKHGSVDKQICFDGMPDMLILGAEILENGLIYVLARVGKKKDQGILLVKIEDDKLVYSRKTLASALETIVVKPGSEKKTAFFDHTLEYLHKKNNTYRGLLELANGHVLAVFQKLGLPACMYYLQFDRAGNLIKQYTHGVLEDYTASADKKNQRPIDMFIRQNTNSQVFPVLIEKTKDGNYFRIGKIDANACTISDFTSYGRKSKEDKNEYYLDKRIPGIDTPNGTYVIISRTGDNKFLAVEEIDFK